MITASEDDGNQDDEPNVMMHGLEAWQEHAY